MVIGIMVGSGIFRTPGAVAAQLGRPGLTLIVWVAGGLIAFAGALIFAELATRYPRAGGKYVYARAAFGPRAGFVVGWVEGLAIYTAAIAAIGVVCGEYLGRLIGASEGQSKALGIGADRTVHAHQSERGRLGEVGAEHLDRDQSPGLAGGDRGRAVARRWSGVGHRSRLRPARRGHGRGAGRRVPGGDLDLLRLPRCWENRRRGGGARQEPAAHFPGRDRGRDCALFAAQHRVLPGAAVRPDRGLQARGGRRDGGAVRQPRRDRAVRAGAARRPGFTQRKHLRHPARHFRPGTRGPRPRVAGPGQSRRLAVGRRCSSSV